MARNTCTFSVKTPKTTLTTTNSKKALQAFEDSIMNNALNFTLQQIGVRAKTAKERDLTVVATFFQRVCARTPLDEEYEYAEGKLHTPDENQCRYDWFVEKNGKRVTAREIQGAYSDVFDTVNDSGSITAVITYLKNEFGDVIYEDGGFEIGNHNDHFATLEYGGYKEDSEKINKGPEYEHGVKNKHSVQAPVGMLRITQMELDSLKKSPAITRLSKRFRQQKVMGRDLTKDQLKRLLSKFKASKRLKLSDIKEYLNI